MNKQNKKYMHPSPFKFPARRTTNRSINDPRTFLETRENITCINVPTRRGVPKLHYVPPALSSKPVHESTSNYTPLLLASSPVALIQYSSKAPFLVTTKQSLT